MARTQISVLEAPGDDDGVELSYAAADSANGMYFKNSGREILLVKNAHSGAWVVTITSVECSHGRTGDVQTSVPASKTYVFGPLDPVLFNQSDQTVYVDFDGSTSLTVACVKV